MKFVHGLLCVLFSDAVAFSTSPIRSNRNFYRPSKPADDGTEPQAENPAETPIATTNKLSFVSRPVARVEKFARLPVWPVVNGVFLWMVQSVLGAATAAAWEDKITGRVCPNFFQYKDTSPFVMLVHHCHSFAAWDPVRFIQATFFPEGFPAHPHRGFVTVTYILDGGFVHRDSVGVRQTYGGSLQSSNNNGVLTEAPSTDDYKKHTQWLHTGSGMLHEEMFDNTSSSWWKPTRQELYQLWLNVPIQDKMNEPVTVLLGGGEETPLVQETTSRTLVLAGTFAGATSAAPIHSPLCVLHVQVEPGGTWTYTELPHFETAMLYVRQGNGLECAGTPIPIHFVAYLEKGIQGPILLQNTDSQTVVDFLFLAGDPLHEPCFSSGSMVMSNPSEINQAYSDYQMGLFGTPWDHKLSDEEWKEHVTVNHPKAKNPLR